MNRDDRLLAWLVWGLLAFMLASWAWQIWTGAYPVSR